MGWATDDDYAINVAAHVLEAMDRDDVSQNEIERKAGFTKGRLSRYMTGDRTGAGPSFLVALAAAIGSNVSRILTKPPDDPRFLDLARRQAGKPPGPTATSPGGAGPERRKSPGAK